MSDKEFELQYREAKIRGEQSMRNEPRAVTVYYDNERRHIIIDLLSGSTFSFPVHLVESLSKADDEEIADVKILGYGFTLEWKRLDEYIGVDALLNGRFGSERWMEKFKNEWAKHK